MSYNRTYPLPLLKTGSSVGAPRRIHSKLYTLNWRSVILQFPEGKPMRTSWGRSPGTSSFTIFRSLQVLDLKGTPRLDQGNLLDNFVTFTSTREHLESTSFLSNIDMDPPAQVQSQILASGTGASGLDSRSLFSGLTSPPPESTSTPPVGTGTGERREVFSDLKRLVTFAVRRDREPR